MKSNFLIQCPHLTPRPLENRVFEKMTQVFPKLFWENDESAYIFWNQVPIRWHYTYELFANFNEILAVCRMLQKEQGGLTKAVIQTDYFLIDWIFKWEGEQLEIKANCLSKKRSYDTYAAAINNVSRIRLTKTEFLNEWKAMFHQVFKAFTSAGVVITDPAERIKYEWMIEMTGRISGYGKLYVKHAQS